MFTLTDTHQIACHGTSFSTLDYTKNYAKYLQTLGLCKTYMIGQYINMKHIKVFDSKKGE